MNADEFNALYDVGVPVFAYPGARPEDIPSARRLVTRTRTEAQTSASGDPVVWVDGEGAYICLTHVDPVSESVWQAAKQDDETAAAGAAKGSQQGQSGGLCGAREPEPRTGTSPCVLPAGHGGMKHQDKWTNQWPALPVPVGDQPQPLDGTLAELAAYRALELGDPDGRVSASCGNPEHPTWLRAPSDSRSCPWCRIAELEKGAALLAALRAAGVDNWEGYDDAVEGVDR